MHAGCELGVAAGGAVLQLGQVLVQAERWCLWCSNEAVDYPRPIGK
jgi:hypothetical protein